MSNNEDTQAILARRKAFIQSALSRDEALAVRAGENDNNDDDEDNVCFTPNICLAIVDPCHTPHCLTPDPGGNTKIPPFGQGPGPRPK